MTKIDDSSLVSLRPGVTLLWREQLYVIDATRTRTLAGLHPPTIFEFVEFIAEGRPISDIVSHFSTYPADSVRSLLAKLDGVLFTITGEPIVRDEDDADGSMDRARHAPILVVGDGLLAQCTVQALATAGFTAVELASAALLGAGSAHWSTLGPGVTIVESPVAGDAAPPAPPSGAAPLHSRIAGKRAVIFAPEHVPVRAALVLEDACIAAGVPCLAIATDGQRLDIGPAVVDPRDAGLACMRAELRKGLIRAVDDPGVVADLPFAGAGDVDRELLQKTLSRLCTEVLAIARGDHDRLRNSVLLYAPDKPVEKRLVARRIPVPSSTEASAGIRHDLTRINSFEPRLTTVGDAPAPGPRHRYRSIGVVGGGSAGYLTALLLKRTQPDLRVTILESPRIPIIGVGEATTSQILPFLHTILGFDIAEFYAEVQPTWKLGIRFEWGRPGDYYFNYPFDQGPLIAAHIHGGDIRKMSLASWLMTQTRGLVLRLPDGTIESLLGDVPFAYHLDNGRFVAYLQKRARERGIGHIACTVSDVEVSDDGAVRALIDSESQRHEFDFYVDCSGFRSQLLGHTLGSRFLSYQASLFTDRAIVANVPHGGVLEPYTTAETMDHGWCWNIPQVEDNHRGYVYASAYCSEEQAVAEMRRCNPGMGDHRVVRFRSGRHEHFIKGNVAAIGNSYGFVEPLESTGLAMICLMADSLAAYLRSTDASVDRLNETQARAWDYLRDFLAIHYKYNQRRDTEFWRACREDTDISNARHLLDSIARSGTFDGRGNRTTFTTEGWTCLLLGQDAFPGRPRPEVSADEFARYAASCERISRHALPQKECLDILAQDAGTEFLDRQARSVWLQVRYFLSSQVI